MKQVVCKICDCMFVTRRDIPTELEPWDCPNCTRDSLRSIQRDIDFLYKTFNYKATYSVLERLDRLWNRQYLFYVTRDMDSTTFF